MNRREYAESFTELSNAELDAKAVSYDKSRIGSHGTGPHIRLIPFEDIKLSTGRRDLVKGVIPRTGITVVWGKPKCGKSFWLFDCLMHVALGWLYRGRRVHQGPVVYCAFEGQTGIEARVEAFRLRHLGDHETKIPFYLQPATLDLIKDHPKLIRVISERLQGERPVAVALDTLNRSLVGSESKDEDMSAYIRAADAIREAFDCASVIVHHCGIEGTRPRGHTALTGALDAQLAVRRDADDNIVVEVELAKDGPQGDVIASSLEIVTVGKDEDGEDITSCIIIPTTAVEEKARAGKWSKGLRIVHESITAALVDQGLNHKIGGDGPAVRAVATEDARTEHGRRYLHTGDGDRAEAERKSWQRNLKAARNQGLIGNELSGGRELIWLIKE
jgi:hypothetical protein